MAALKTSSLEKKSSYKENPDGETFQLFGSLGAQRQKHMHLIHNILVTASSVLAATATPLVWEK